MKEEVDADGQLMKTFLKLNTTIEASFRKETRVKFMVRYISDSTKDGSIHKMVKNKINISA
jgi:hypothetical protein